MNIEYEYEREYCSQYSKESRLILVLVSLHRPCLESELIIRFQKKEWLIHTTHSIPYKSSWVVC